MPDNDDEVLFSETLLGEDDEQAEMEEEEAKKYMDPEEKLLAIISGVVDGNSSLDRLAVTNFFLPRKNWIF